MQSCMEAKEYAHAQGSMACVCKHSGAHDNALRQTVTVRVCQFVADKAYVQVSVCVSQLAYC